MPKGSRGARRWAAGAGAAVLSASCWTVGAGAREGETPSNLDYLVLASMADSPQFLAMAAYRPIQKNP